MSIKILGGIGKGLSLFVPDIETIRPTSIMLRRKIFDANQDMNNILFYDLCAGTGSVGLEALSRGASQVYLIEKNKQLFNILKKNCDSFSNATRNICDAKYFVVKQDCQDWVKYFREQYKKMSAFEQSNCIIFLDPPYTLHQIYQNILDDPLFSEGIFIGKLWIESDQYKGPKDSFFERYEHYGVVKKYSQSSSYIIVINCSK